jgi:precorrin-2 dehydrogenase/sirohydrochlorin ferrochelatase
VSGYYPLFLKVKDKKCVVIGGGEVAERKVKGLLEQSARVEVISPGITPYLRQLAEQGKITVAEREYHPGDLKGSLLAIAATDSSRVNKEVAQEGEREGILVNVVDDPEQSTFIVPSVVQRGDLRIAISTGGHSPALARKIRQELEHHFPPEYALLLPLVSEVRQQLRHEQQTVDSEVWQESLDIPQLLELLRQGEFHQAKKRLLSALKGEKASAAKFSRGRDNESSGSGNKS